MRLRHVRLITCLHVVEFNLALDRWHWYGVWLVLQVNRLVEQTEKGRRRAERHDRERGECRRGGDDRCEREEPLVGRRRSQLLLEHQLDDVRERLRSALEKDKSLRVLVASGYCDLATPFAGTNYTFAHMGPRALMDQVTMTYYDAGHMHYTHEPSRKKLRDDLVKFMTAPAAADKKP